jgi:hypothetical protein
VLLTEDYLSAAGSGFEKPSQVPAGIPLCVVLPGDQFPTGAGLCQAEVQRLLTAHYNTNETASCSDVTGNYCNQSTITFKSLGKGDWRCPASRRKIPGKLCFFVTQQQPASIATIKFTGSLLRLPEQESGAVNHLAHRNIVGVGRPANDFLRQEPAAPISARPGKGQPVRVVPAGINSYLRSGWIRNESALTQWPDYECEGSIDSCLSFPSTLSTGL